MAVRRVEVVRQSPASKDMNTEAAEAMVLDAITRRQPVKVQQTAHMGLGAPTKVLKDYTRNVPTP
jgi:hypothetical protein